MGLPPNKKNLGVGLSALSFLRLVLLNFGRFPKQKRIPLQSLSRTPIPVYSICKMMINKLNFLHQSKTPFST